MLTLYEKGLLLRGKKNLKHLSVQERKVSNAKAEQLKYPIWLLMFGFLANGGAQMKRKKKD